MYKLFLSVWVSLLFLSQACAYQDLAQSTSSVKAPSNDKELESVVVGRPLTSRVFIGSHDKLPIGERYVISIDTSGKHGAMPTTISQAFQVLENILPIWYQNALLFADGENECSVFVNGYTIDFYVAAWMEESWLLNQPDSPIYREFESLRLYDRDAVSYMLLYAFCYYLKFDEETAMKTVNCLMDAKEEDDEAAAIGCRRE